MDIVRERTLRPPTPDSPAPIDGVEPPPLPTAVPPTPPTLPEYEIPVSKGYGPLRIDKGSPRGALYLGTCIHNNGSCNGTLYIS